MFRILVNKIIHKSLLEGQILECIWTLIPALILIQMIFFIHFNGPGTWSKSNKTKQFLEFQEAHLTVRLEPIIWSPSTMVYLGT